MLGHAAAHNIINMKEEGMRKLLVIVTVLTSMLSFGIAEAVSTKLVIHAKSKDAKFVGTSMGGAKIVIKDSESGKVLAEGLTSGGTGNTQKIMIDPKTRFGRITGSGTAFYETTIDIDEPRLVTIEVVAPYGMKPNTVTSTTQIWLIPGKDITGEGVIIEVPGFSVSAAAVDQVKLAGGRADIPVQARIVMI